MLIPTEIFERTTHYYFTNIRQRSLVIYATVLVAIFLALAALPFIKVDISVKSVGMIRPIAEKTEIKALVSAKIQEVLVKENQFVQKNQVLFRLNDQTIQFQIELLSQRNTELQSYLLDLSKIMVLDSANINKNLSLKNSLFEQQYTQFLAQIEAKKQTIDHIEQELKADQKLFEAKAISKRELENKNLELKKLRTDWWVFFQNQQNFWQKEHKTYLFEFEKNQNQLQQLNQEQNNYEIKATVTGNLQGITGKYPNYTVQTGEILGNISPDSTLIAECFVESKDIGLLKVGQKAKFQIEAYNYQEWGILEGKIIEIAHDVEILDQKPIFRVKCQLDKDFLSLKNGFQGKLKKGMKLQSRFFIQNRSLYHLLFDTINDWLNPTQE